MYCIFIKPGDARDEVDDLIVGLGQTAEAAGLHKYLFVTRANHTVVMLSDPAAPLAAVLRVRDGWSEPEAGPPPARPLQ